MMPCFSTAEPTMNPGTSCRNTSGMPNASHSLTKRATLSAAFTSSAPPSTIGWLATTPTGRPAQRARPARSVFAPPALAARPPGDARQARELVLRPPRLHPQHVAVVDERRHDLAHVVGAPGR